MSYEVSTMFNTNNAGIDLFVDHCPWDLTNVHLVGTRESQKRIKVYIRINILLIHTKQYRKEFTLIV